MLMQTSLSAASFIFLVLATVALQSIDCYGQDCWYPSQQWQHISHDDCIQRAPLIDSRFKNKQHKMMPAVDKSIRHVPVLHKVTRQVTECRTRHIPVVRHRYRTVEEKYTEHVPVTETVSRPVVDTVVKQVPVIQRKSRPILDRNRHFRSPTSNICCQSYSC